MIKIDHLTALRRTLAVDDLDFEVRPGVVTGFSGQRLGKSTTMRIILGLDRPPRAARR